MVNVAVYSTFCGPTDKATFKRSKVDSRFPHLFFSNNKEILSIAAEDGWEPIHLDLEIFSDSIASSMQAKIVKAVPHYFDRLMEYEFIFYKDDKVNLNNDLILPAVENMLQMEAAYSVLRHPYHKDGNVLTEYGESLFQKRYSAYFMETAKYIVDQVNNEGLNLMGDMFYATTAILRNNRHQDTIKINEMWYDHILRTGPCCQVNFHFVAQRFKSIIPLPHGIIC